MADIREPAVAGMFYPRSSKELGKNVLDLLDRASVADIPGALKALVVPHAGLIYSGVVAAHGFQLLRARPFETVILLGPNHHQVGFRGTSVYSKGAFKTPLGEVAIDEALAEDILAKDTGAVFNAEAHSREHAIEVEIPFLQVVLPRAEIVPIVMADYEWKTCQRLAQAMVYGIRKHKEKKVLIVVSTDLSHDHSYEKAVRMDRIAIQDIESMDPGRLYMDAARQERTELCGFGPVLAVLIAARELGANSAKTLAYANSGDVTEDRSRVVGYTAMALYERSIEDRLLLKEMEEAFLSEEEKKVLCGLARDTLKAHFKGGSPPAFRQEMRGLFQKRPVFVTLRKDGELRGCVGTLFKEKPLAQAVQEMALAAAFRDGRFEPLRQDSLDEIRIEISVLSDFARANSIEAIEVGRHGILIRKGACAGLLLPQVAVEEGWDRQTFLAEACLKAGLLPHEWKDGAEIFVFSALKFGEDGAREYGKNPLRF